MYLPRLCITLWGVLAIVLVGPVTEELVFRMGIQRHLIRHRMRPWMAILLSALIFGAVHGNPAQIPGAVVFGWVLGWLYWRSGTIWIPVAAHVFNNFVGVAMIWCTEDTDTTFGGVVRRCRRSFRLGFGGCGLRICGVPLFGQGA